MIIKIQDVTKTPDEICCTFHGSISSKNLNKKRPFFLNTKANFPWISSRSRVQYIIFPSLFLVEMSCYFQNPYAKIKQELDPCTWVTRK